MQLNGDENLPDMLPGMSVGADQPRQARSHLLRRASRQRKLSAQTAGADTWFQLRDEHVCFVEQPKNVGSC
jgi:hypothetical protein